ncbi:LysR substrate-binding domain-containing protein [Pseudoalteromonas fenneropenaei]|uniref:LysR substrate-binding domain-containing protein n=1 Tax=Pseudoalteromonas fenneropenaei TaxID=1737459 RepID=A0ABV7CR02_9GAMM
MSTPTLKQLQAFVTITQAKSLSAAAEQLYLSKAALSSALAELEKNLGHAVFDRVNNRLLLNQEGRRLLPLADELLTRANEIAQLFSQDAQMAGILRLGASDTIGNQVMPALLGTLRQQFPAAQPTLHITNSTRIINMLLDFELDLGLVEGQVSHAMLDTQVFMQDEMCIIASHTHPLVGRPVTELAELVGQTWLMRETGSGTREYFVQHVAPKVTAWLLSMQLNSTEALLNAVAAGLGLACVSTRAARYALADGRVCRLPIVLQPLRQFSLVVHRDKYRSPLLQACMAQCLRDIEA